MPKQQVNLDLNGVYEGSDAVAPKVAFKKKKSIGSMFAYLFFAPSIILIVLFSYYPALRSIEGALTSWNGFSSPQFVGLGNFVQYFTGSNFLVEVRNMLVLFFGGLFILFAFPLFGAKLVQNLSPRMNGIAKYLFVLPMAIPYVIVINVWAYVLNPDQGIVDGVLALIHTPAIQWLSNPHTALLSILLIGFPWISGLQFLIFLAGLQGIPQDLYDACSVDGAKSLVTFFKMELPLLIPQIRFVLVLSGVGIVQNFIPILLLTNGGPENATMIPALDMYNSAFQNSQFGYGMAIGTVLFIGLLIFTVVVLKYLKPRT